MHQLFSYTSKEFGLYDFNRIADILELLIMVYTLMFQRVTSFMPEAGA